jgi:hypothetical protein
MKLSTLSAWMLCAVVLAPAALCAQHGPARKPVGEVLLHIASTLPGNHQRVPAVAWLEPMPGTPEPPFAPGGHYTLLQKNRTFIPHLQVIPVGAVVQFPNADPFFHNVFSLFEGKRFDLGLYEAGSSKSVSFTREGVSYIFCNIHPEMSAVIVALSTPLYSIANADDLLVLRDVPPGNYRLHLWIEGVPQSFLNGLSRSVRVSPQVLDLGTLKAPIASRAKMTHMNKFGNPYDTESETPYE